MVDSDLNNYSERERISIDNSWYYGCNKCLICNEDFTHRRMWIGNEELQGLFLLRDTVAHASCLKLVNEIKKKKEELCELEFKLFEKRFFIKQ